MFIKPMVKTSQGRWCFTIISLFLPKGRVVHTTVLHNWYLLTGFYLGLEMETWPRSHKGPLLTKVLAPLFASLPGPARASCNQCFRHCWWVGTSGEKKQEYEMKQTPQIFTLEKRKVWLFYYLISSLEIQTWLNLFKGDFIALGYTPNKQ